MVEPGEGPADTTDASAVAALQALQHEVAETQLPDHILRVLVSVCNRGSLSFGITVAQSGLLISGTAVGVAQFMHNMAGELEVRGGVDAAVLTDPLRLLARLAEVDRDDVPPAPSDDGTDDLPVFIHLEHARIRSGAAIVAEDVRWRGRMVDIDGWFLGQDLRAGA